MKMRWDKIKWDGEEELITLELARGTNIPRKNIPNRGPPQIPKMLYANYRDKTKVHVSFSMSSWNKDVLSNWSSRFNLKTIGENPWIQGTSILREYKRNTDEPAKP